MLNGSFGFHKWNSRDGYYGTACSAVQVSHLFWVFRTLHFAEASESDMLPSW
jgi:hypothetical protein